MYLAGMAIYSAVAVFHLTRPPRFWPECGLLAIIASVLVSAVLSSRAVLVDSLVIGALLSLVCAYVLDWLTWVYCADSFRVETGPSLDATES